MLYPSLFQLHDHIRHIVLSVVQEVVIVLNYGTCILCDHVISLMLWAELHYPVVILVQQCQNVLAFVFKVLPCYRNTH